MRHTTAHHATHFDCEFVLVIVIMEEVLDRGLTFVEGGGAVLATTGHRTNGDGHCEEKKGEAIGVEMIS